METVRHLVRRVLRHKDTFCGWLYGKQEIESLISEYYDIERHANMGNSALYLLSSADCPRTASQDQGFAPLVSKSPILQGHTPSHRTLLSGDLQDMTTNINFSI